MACKLAALCTRSLAGRVRYPLDAPLVVDGGKDRHVDSQHMVFFATARRSCTYQVVRGARSRCIVANASHTCNQVQCPRRMGRCSVPGETDLRTHGDGVAQRSALSPNHWSSIGER